MKLLNSKILLASASSLLVLGACKSDQNANKATAVAPGVKTPARQP